MVISFEYFSPSGLILLYTPPRKPTSFQDQPLIKTLDFEKPTIAKHHHSSLLIMVNKDTSHPDGQHKASTDSFSENQRQMRRAIPDYLSSVHEERIPLSDKLKDPDFRTELDAKVKFCADRERIISPETKLNYLIMHGWYTLEEQGKKLAYEPQISEEERERKDKESDDHIERLKKRSEELDVRLMEMERRSGKKITANGHKASDMMSEVLKKSLEKAEKISALTEIVWRRQAEVDHEFSDLVRRWKVLEETLAMKEKNPGEHRQRAHELIRQYGDPKLSMAEKFALATEGVRELEAELKQTESWRGYCKQHFSHDK